MPQQSENVSVKRITVPVLLVVIGLVSIAATAFGIVYGRTTENSQAIAKNSEAIIENQLVIAQLLILVDGNQDAIESHIETDRIVRNGDVHEALRD